MFNISARPPSDLVVGLTSPMLQISPSRLTLNRDTTVASFEVSGRVTGQHTLTYDVSGAISDEFEMPDSVPVLVSSRRDPASINHFFRLLKTEPGIVRESCCQPRNFVYSECPMSTDRVIFRSTCSWTSDNTEHETSGVVFAQYKSLTLPLSINGIKINYDTGSISTRLSQIPITACEPCRLNRGAVLTRPLRIPTCYYHKFDSGDLEDMLMSRSLANTFINRLSTMFPSWFKVSIPAITGMASYRDIDFTVSLVEQDDISSVSGCGSIATEDAGLYVLLRYQQAFEVSVDGSAHNSSAGQDDTPICIAVNLCKEMDSPIFLGLPQSVQSVFRQLPVMAPYNTWQYIIRAVTLYSRGTNPTTTDRFWNGTEYYTPGFSTFDLQVNVEATAIIDLLIPNSSLTINCEGDIFSFFPAEEVTPKIIYYNDSVQCVY